MNLNSSSENFELHEAAKKGDVLIVKGLLADKPSLVFKKDLDGRSPLHWAVSSEHEEIVSLLLNPYKINADELSGNDGDLIDKNRTVREIDIDDLLDDAGWSPLHICCSVGNFKILKLLLSANPKPDVNLQTNMGLTGLHLATAKKYADIVEFLVKQHHASARVKDKRGQYPLHRAASVGCNKIIEILCKDGKSPLNAKDNSGWTPLHHALAEGNGDSAVLLVKLGADPTVENKEGLTPLKVAVDEKVANYFKATCLQELDVHVH